MNEKNIDDEVARILQKQGIDFTRIKNSNFRGGFKNYNTTAFGEPFQCDKYVADFIIFHGGKTWLIENAMKHGNTLSNAKRKKKQRARGEHWETEGGCYYQVLTSIEEVNEFFKRLLTGVLG
jgi:hypothetical protein